MLPEDAAYLASADPQREDGPVPDVPTPDVACRYVLLTDDDNGTILVSCQDTAQAEALARAAVFSDGGVSAWYLPSLVVRHADWMLVELQESANTSHLHDHEGRTYRPITITEGEPTDD